MSRSLRLILVLFTTVAAFAAGVLNGRVVCMAGSNDVAFEEPHRGVEHSSHDHGCGDEDGPAHSDGDDRHPDSDRHAPAGGCTDMGAGGTLVREAAPSGYDHQHVQLSLPLVPAALSSLLHTSCPRSVELRFAGTPPALADLACLRSIILLV